MKKTRTTLLALALTGALAISAGAAATLQQVIADVRRDITVTVDGGKEVLRDANGKEVYPLTIDGTTYLPIRALGEITGQSVTWDEKNLVVGLTSWKTDETGTIAALTRRAATAAAEVKALKSAATQAERAAQYAKESAKLEELRADIEGAANKLNSDLRAGRIDYTEYNIQSQKLLDLDVRVKDIRIALEDKTIGYTPEQKPDSKRYEEYQAQITALEKKVAAAVTAKDEKAVEALDKELDTLDDALEQSYKKKELSAPEYRSLEHALDTVEDKLEDAEDLWDDADEDDDEKDDD